MTRYEMLDRIGVGGMAEIFRGRAIAGGGFEKPVAIKRILPHLSQDERFVQMLIAEANTLSQLRHRNIVQIFDVGLGDDGQYFLVMEYVPGSDLRALLEALEERGKRLPAHLSLHIAAEIADALDFAHRATDSAGRPLRLVHRDVSPSNVLLSRNGEVKLTDFGIAKRMEDVTGHHGVRGKFAYISPEQADNRPVDGRSDVFSLGIVLLEMISGRRVFSALNDVDALQAVRAGQIPRPRDLDPDMPSELEAIVRRAIAVRPEDRYQTAGELSAALRSYRYSALTTAGDPAIELARILSLARRSGDDAAFAQEATILRIETAAGFTGVGLGPGGAGPGALGPAFDDEATRAMPGAQIRELMAAAEGSQRFEQEPTQDVELEQLLDVAPLAEAETAMLDLRSRTDGGAAPAGVVDGEATIRQGVASLAPPGGHTAEAPPGGHTAEAPPGGHTAEAPPPRYPIHASQHDVETEYVQRVAAPAAPRRAARAAAVVGGAVVLGIAAFVVTGKVVGRGGASGAASSGDAEGASVVVPREEIEVAPPVDASAADTGAGSKPSPAGAAGPAGDRPHRAADAPAPKKKVKRKVRVRKKKKRRRR